MQTRSTTTATCPAPISNLGRRVTQGVVIVLAGLLTTHCACTRSQTPPEGPAAPATPVETTPNDATPTAETPQDAAKPAVALPASLDTLDLDADEKAVLGEILREQFDPCGKPRSFLDSLNASDTCELAPRLANLAVARISDGWSKKQTVTILMQELAKASKKFEFDLSNAACHGTPREGQHIIVEYSDFQCPFCAKAFKPAKELADKHGALLCAKQMPLDFHPLARPAALAALAAQNQGKYWEYAEKVFADQDALSDARLVAIAKELALDLKRFEADRTSEATAAILKRDLDEADLAGVEGTPSFFVDGIAVDFEALDEALGGGHADH